MNAKPALVVCVLLLPCLAPAAWSGEPAAPEVPEKPWFPFPELPAVLFYEDFLDGVGAATMGKVEDAPDLPGCKAYLLGEVSLSNSDKKGSATKINLAQTKLKVPGIYKPGDIRIYFTYWAEEAMDAQLTFHGKERYIHRLPLTAAKKWTPVTLGFAELKAGEKRQPMKPNELFTELEVLFYPHSGKAYQKVYIADILVTNGVLKATEVLPLVQRFRKRAKDIEKTTAKDGFSFQPQNQDGMRSLLAASLRKKKDKAVLFIGPRPTDGPALLKALNAAAKSKLPGYTFVPAEAPDNSPVGGLADMRTLLKHNLDKSSALLVLLLLSYKDVNAPAESVRVVVERVLGAGCIPIVCLPPLFASLSPPDKSKAEGFVNAVNNICTPKGVVMIEASSVLKDVANPLEEGELSTAGLEGVAGVAVNALKHLDTYLLGRR